MRFYSLNIVNIIKFIKKKYKYIFIILIPIIIFALTYLTANHIILLLADRGREFSIPAEMLKGKVLYKDIMLIYFPLAYYINAFLYKLFGVHINSITYSQAFFCSIYMIGYYLLASIFLQRKEAFLITMLVICSCIFSEYDLFNFVTPYAYATSYGVIGFFFCLFFLVKLFKTNKIFFAYLAAFFAGFSFSCKLDFFTVWILLIVCLFLYRKLSFKQYLFVFVSSLTVPLITLCSLFMQGVSVKDITDMIIFGMKFSKTPVMIEYLQRSGMYPGNIGELLYYTSLSFPKFCTLVTVTLCGLKLYYRYKKLYILILVPILIIPLIYSRTFFQYCWVLLPILLFIFGCINIKKIMMVKREYLILLLAALLNSQRVFFMLKTEHYSTLFLPLLLLCLYVYIRKFASKYIWNVETKKLVIFITLIFIIIYAQTIVDRCEATNMPITTKHGVIYVTQQVHEIIKKVQTHIEKNTDKQDSILVLPEGNIINFLFDRPVDMKCYMMDRLYHDAYGEENALKKVAQTNSDYIYIIQRPIPTDFDRPFLYSPGTPLREYINENYKRNGIYGNDLGIITIYKKRQK